MATTQTASVTAPVPATSATPVTQPLHWESVYPKEAWRRIRWEGLYLALVLLAAVVVTWLMFYVDMPSHPHPTAKRLLCCGLGGITGSWIYSIRWYTKAVTGGLWAHDFIVWRLTSPFVGIFLAVSTYLVMETGLLGVTFNKSNADPSTYAYAIGFLVGLFSDDVMKKLTEVANTLFGTASRRDPRPGPRGAPPHKANGAPEKAQPGSGQPADIQSPNQQPAGAPQENTQPENAQLGSEQAVDPAPA